MALVTNMRYAITTIIISPESRNLVHLRLSVQQLCLKCSQHWFHLLYSTQLTLIKNFDVDSKNHNMILVQFENLEKHRSLRHLESSLWQRLDIVCRHLGLTDSPVFWSWCSNLWQLWFLPVCKEHDGVTLVCNLTIQLHNPLGTKIGKPNFRCQRIGTCKTQWYDE